MTFETDARSLLESLVGQQIRTATGRPNTVLRLEGDSAVVATTRSPAGEPVPISWVQAGLERLVQTGEVEISVSSLRHRSSFVGAALLTLAGTVLLSTTPPRIRMTEPVTAYRLSDAGPVNAWWSGESRQRFWLEITDRPDIGVDLHCPQRDATGHRNPGYSLICWIDVDDVVFHYSSTERAIIAWSRAVGTVTEAPTIWLSHRAATRRRLQVPHPQPGWWLDLDGPFLLDERVSLDQLRDRSDDIRAVLDTLKVTQPGSLYFPFFFWGGTELRPMQPYLNKMPAELIDLFPRLAAAAVVAPLPSRQSPAGMEPTLGTPYREARVNPMPDARQPFAVDPAIVERGLRGHADTQNSLARALLAAGIEPRSRLPYEPNFDISWKAEGTVFVAEVKSITNDNEEEQLRLGLGQVLRYRHRLQQLGHERVVAVLVPERPPSDRAWTALCRELRVELLSGRELERAPLLGRDLNSANSA